MNNSECKDNCDIGYADGATLLSGSDTAVKKFPLWMGKYPRHQAAMLREESNHILDLYQSGEPIYSIAGQTLRTAREIHVELLNNEVYNSFVHDNTYDIVCSSFDKDMSMLFKAAPSNDIQGADTLSLAIIIYASIIVAIGSWTMI